MLWINFLHLYQPANEDAHNIKDATEKSYSRIVRALEENPKTKFTLNITGCLFLRWEELGYQDLILRIKKLVKKGQIELTGSAAYHALLPLMPKEEVLNQIKENEAILKKYLGSGLKFKGFFFPEMAYGDEVAKSVKKMGYEWIIVDEIAFSGRSGEADCSEVYLDKNSGLKTLFRSRSDSYNYVPKFIFDKLAQNEKRFMITATDGELYGLRHEDPDAYFEKLLKQENLETELISKYIAKNKNPQSIKLLNSSWESTEKEIAQNKPYILWIDKKNKIQQSIWRLFDLAYKNYHDNLKDKNAHWIRWHLVRGSASCTFWWASAKDFSHVYGPHAWSPDLIERGINDLIRSIRATDNEKSRKLKIEAEKLYIKIKQSVWNKHWSYYWKK